jgi:dipeptidyl aminopeptidase/acylaminoacyl peptidase
VFFPLLAIAQNGHVVARIEFASGSQEFRAEEVAYLSDGLRIKGYLLTPAQEGKHPCIIFNRGGNPQLDSLSRESVVRGHAAMLASAGYMIVASQYRQGGGSEGYDEFGGNDVHDVLNLIPLLEHEPACDASRIGMFGVSRGGMMTYLTLTKTDRIRAAVVLSGLSDLALNLKSRPDDMGKVYQTYIPDYGRRREQALAERSAVRWAEKIDKKTPLLVLQGTADWRVGPAESLEMADALLRSKHPFRFVLFEGGAHGLPEHRIEVDRLLLNWFNDYLRDGKKWPSLEPHGQ